MQVLDLKEWVIREKERVNKLLMNSQHYDKRYEKLLHRSMHLNRILQRYPSDVKVLRHRLDGGMIPGQIAIYSAGSGVGRSSLLDFDNNSDKE